MDASKQNLQFPMERDGVAPPLAYSQLRKQGQLSKVSLYDGSEAWLATAYNDVRQILGDHRFSTNPKQPGYPMLTAARAALLMHESPQTFIRKDAPEHSKHRRMFTRDFMIKLIDSMRPEIQTTVDNLLDQLVSKGPPCDLFKEFALPIPTAIISRLLGVPYESHEFIHSRSRDKLNISNDGQVAIRANDELRAFLGDIAREKLARGDRNDIMSRLFLDHVANGEMSFDEGVATIDLLIRGGHETSATMIALGVVGLLKYPDQKEKIVNRPELVANAVEEMLRFYTIAQYVGARVAIEDVTIGDTKISKGEGVLALLHAANYDPDVFPHPLDFDVERNVVGHVAFGYGVHQCLGQALARAELQIVFGALFQRIPSLRLAVPAEELVFNKGALVFGIESLPVIW